jgi:ring-1,2-phenylacetyl-CoA epoxidase subunit PaaD
VSGVAEPAAHVARVRALLDDVFDPEIPVLTIGDLGVLRAVEVEDGATVVTVTPTYSGCPAMDAIRADIAVVLHRAGVTDFEIRTAYAPAWTTDWMGEAAKTKLAEFGIAPPARVAEAMVAPVRCPRCRSTATTTISEFGSTACKALVVCDACREPFDLFKAI